MTTTYSVSKNDCAAPDTMKGVDENIKMQSAYIRMGYGRIYGHYLEILKLHDLLERAEIDHEMTAYMGGWHIVVKKNGERLISVVEHAGSYGHEKDLLEICGLLTPAEIEIGDVVGYLSANDVFVRIKNAL